MQEHRVDYALCGANFDSDGTVLLPISGSEELTVLESCLESLEYKRIGAPKGFKILWGDQGSGQLATEADLKKCDRANRGQSTYILLTALLPVAECLEASGFGIVDYGVIETGFNVNYR